MEHNLTEDRNTKWEIQGPTLSSETTPTVASMTSILLSLPL